MIENRENRGPWGFHIAFPVDGSRGRE